MQSCLPHPVTERARPWLGTLVSIRAEGVPRDEAHAAISAAFREIELVHQLMSFHSPDSDVSRLNRNRSAGPVAVHPYTFEVLQQAIALSAVTDGCFDISVAAELVRWGWLPRPSITDVFPHGSWRDIELLADGSVKFHQPLWIDLGGIAKGYAVDRAARCLQRHGIPHAVVNAGGDIRVVGPQSEWIALQLDLPTQDVPVMELADGSIASSSGDRQRRESGHLHGPHVDRLHRSSAAAGRFVCVLAEQCTVADALTKVVIATGPDGIATLRSYNASAHLFDAGTGWQSLNVAMDCS